MKFKAGEYVRVKYYKDLIKEHEIQENKIIVGNCYFLREMKVYCGEVYKIKQRNGREYELCLKDGGDWYFDEDMLELPTKAETDTTSHEITKGAEEVEKPKRTYTKTKVE